MISVDEHLARILERVHPLHPLDVQLLEAHGCVLAEDVTAPTDLPPWDNSAMDGYAVVLADVAAASARSPVRLPVVGDIPAGSQVPHALRPGQAIRIMTGAPLPSGAEAVVPVEWTDRGEEFVEVRQAPDAGQHLRLRGDDVRAGSALLAAGTRLGPRHVALLAAVGRARVLVRPRPRVVVVSTGSELVEPGASVGFGQIPDANGPALTAAARDAGAIVYRVGIVPDEPRTLLDTIEDQLVRADAVITTGGVSAGAYDVVKEVLGSLGTVSFTSVAMQPGKPQGFGTVGPDDTPIFTLPGNPVSAFVSFEVFVRPAIARMRGVESLQRPMLRARCAGGLESRPGVRQFLRASLSRRADDVPVAVPLAGQGSHMIGGLAQSDCLLVVPEDVTRVAPWDEVDVLLLDRPATAGERA